MESKVLFRARNKKAVAIETHATLEARHHGGPDAASTSGRCPSLTAPKFCAAAPPTCDDTKGPCSTDQPLNSASFHSVEGVHNIAVVEHGEQALDSAQRVVLARCDIFRQDATCILHRAQYRFLIGRVQTELLAQQNRELKQRQADSFQSLWCVMRGGPSPVQRDTSPAASLRDKDVPLHGPRPQALCLPTDSVRVNPGPCAGSEVIVQCGFRFETTRFSHTSRTLSCR